MPHGITATDSLASFTNEPNRFLEKLRQTGEPILLTQDSGANVVVQDAGSYQRMLDMMDQLEALAAVKEGLQDVAAGRTRPMRAALAELGDCPRIKSAYPLA